MDVKTAAATARTALRAATKTDGDPLHGLTVSVRVERASQCTTIAIAVGGLDEHDVVRPRADRAPGQGWATDRAHAIADRVRELAAAAYTWASEHPSMRFVADTIAAVSAPLPRPAAEPAAAVVDEPADGPAVDVDDLTDDVVPGELPAAAAAVAWTAPAIARALAVGIREVGVQGMRDLLGLTAPAHRPAPSVPAQATRSARPALRVLPGGADARDGAVPPAVRAEDGPNRRVVLRPVPDHEAAVLAALAGERGELEQVAAGMVLCAAMRGDYLADPARVAAVVDEVVTEARGLVSAGAR